MRRIIAIALVLMMIVSMTACVGEDKVEISVVLKTLASEYWGYVKNGCDAAAKELGITVTVVGPDAESNIAGQVTMIEEQIAAGCDAIVCAPNDAAAAANALKAAIDKGIPVLSVDTNVGMEGQTSFVGTSNVDAAKQGGLWAAEQLGEGAKAVIIYGQEGDNTSNMRREGYEAACKGKSIEVLAALSGQNTTDGATKTMEDLLSAHPGQIDVVFCHNDDTAIGAMNACESAGVSDILIVGFDGNKSAVELIMADELIKATVAQQPFAMGYEVVKAAYAAIQGQKVDAVISAPVKVVTKENGQEYLDSL
jgi:ribose transport system substrate-binding protein